MVAPPPPPPVQPLAITPPISMTQANPAGSVTMAVKLSDPLLAVGGARDEYLKIEMQGVAVPGQRAPVNLAVVLDRSGSMAGEKLESARRAAHTLVDRLDGRDRLAFVTFGSNVTPLFPSTPCTAGARGTMHAAIDRIYDMGGTNLSGGLQAGIREVEAHAEGFAVNRVILISDGEANEGITTRAGLSHLAQDAARRQVSVSAFGVGVDFDEDTMELLAESGGGNYRFLATGAGLEPIFNSELAQLSTAVAATPVLSLNLPEGVTLTEVFGYPFERDGNHLQIALPDFAAGEHRKLVVQLRVDAGVLGTRPVGEVQLAYVDLLHDRRAVQLAQRSQATIIESEARASADKDRETYAQVARVHAATRARKAAMLYASGDVAQATRELAGARDEANAFNAVAQDASLGADLDRIAPATAPVPMPSSEAGRAAAKDMKQKAYDSFR
jgi:Ca-activated chloride channel family protein